MNEVEIRKESTIKDFLEVIFRRKWIIVGIVAAATAVVMIINMREPAVYESSSKLLVKRGEQPGVFSRSVQTLSWEEEISSQIEMVKSSIVAERAQQLVADYAPPGYATDRRISAGRIGAGVVSTSNVIWVAYTSSDPIFCEVAVNAIVNAYKEYYQQVRTPPEMEDFFSREMQTMKEEIEYWRERKKRVGKEWNLIDLEQQQRETIRDLAVYRRELDQVTQDLEEKESIVRYVEALRGQSDATLPTVTSGLLAPAGQSSIEKMRSIITNLQIQESQLAVSYTGEYKKLKEIRKQIDEMQTLMDNEINAYLSIEQTQLDVLRMRQRYLRDMVARFEMESKTFPEKEVELEQINIAMRRAQDDYNKMVDQHMASKISLASNPEWTVTILNPASRGYRKKARDYVRIALGPAFSLIVALGFAFFIDNLDHSIKNIAEAEEALNLQVLASFPDRRKR